MLKEEILTFVEGIGSEAGKNITQGDYWHGKTAATSLLREFLGMLPSGIIEVKALREVVESLYSDSIRILNMDVKRNDYWQGQHTAYCQVIDFLRKTCF